MPTFNDETLYDRYQREHLDELRMNERNAIDAALWRDLVSNQVFNNVPAVGYAINRSKERVARSRTASVSDDWDEK